MRDVIMVTIDREVEDDDGDIGVVVAVEDEGLGAAPTVAGGVENVDAALEGDSSLD